MAVDGGQCFARHWLGTDNPVVYRFGFTLFHGEYRVKQFGYSSAITNVTLVVATAVTGYPGRGKLALAFRGISASVGFSAACRVFEGRYRSAAENRRYGYRCSGGIKRAIPGKYGIHVRHLLQLMLFYGVTTYVVLAVTFDLPFLMDTITSPAEIPD